MTLTLAALASLILGYYLGQYWQRKPLADTSALVYPNGIALRYPADWPVPDGAQPATWRLYFSVDSRNPACQQAVRHYIGVFNRLATWPDIQRRLRLGILAYDIPDAAEITRLTGDIEPIEVMALRPALLDQLNGQLGRLPDHNRWCTSDQLGASLVAPDAVAWALIPFDEPAIMATSIKAVIEFVE